MHRTPPSDGTESNVRSRTCSDGRGAPDQRTTRVLRRSLRRVCSLRRRPAPSSSRRSRCSATVVVRSRTSARVPGRSSCRAIARAGAVGDRHVHPPDRLLRRPAARAGDARHAHADVGPKRASAPSASASATSAETAPNALDQRRIDARQRRLRLVRVDDDAAQHVGRGARPLGQPPRQQPAGARLGDRDRAQRRAAQQRRDLLVDRRAVLGEQLGGVARADEVDERRVGVLSARLVQRRDLDLAAPQAGRDLQRREVEPRLLGDDERLGDLRLGDPRSAAGSPARTSVAPATAARNASVSRAAAHIGCSSRGGPGSTTTVGAGRRPSAAARPRPAPSRPARAPSRPRGTCACLRVPRAIAARSTFGQRCASGATIAAIRCSSASSSTSRRPAKSATTSVVRSSAVGPRPPLVTIRSTRSAARKRSAAAMSSRRSPTIRMCARSTPSSRSRSDSHGPLRSAMIPLRTSVPVMTMPARALTCRSAPGRPAAGARRVGVIS